MASITVHILSGRGLAAMDKNGLSDPYVVLKLMDKKAKKKKKDKTKVHNETLSPVWHESFNFKIDATVAELKLECWDKDMLKDEFMGQIIIPVDALLSANGEEQWLPLHAKSGSKRQVIGEIQIRIDQGTTTLPASEETAEKKTPRKKTFMSLSRSSKLEAPPSDGSDAADHGTSSGQTTPGASTSSAPQPLKLEELAASLAASVKSDSAVAAAESHAATSADTTATLDSSASRSLESSLQDVSAEASGAPDIAPSPALAALAAQLASSVSSTTATGDDLAGSYQDSLARSEPSPPAALSSSSSSTSTPTHPTSLRSAVDGGDGTPEASPSLEGSAARSLSISDRLRDSSDASAGFSIFITAGSGRNLASKDSNGLSDPYLQFSAESAKKTLREVKTKVIDKTLNPVWNERLELAIDRDCTQVRVECWDKDVIGKNFMGCFVLSLNQIMTADGSEQWFPLGPKEGSKKADKITGEVSLRIEFSNSSVEKKRGTTLFSAVKGVVNSAEDAAKFGIDNVARGAKTTISTGVAGGKLVGGVATKGVKLTINTAGAGVAGVGGIAAAGVGGIAQGVGGIAHGVGGIAAAGVGGIAAGVGGIAAGVGGIAAAGVGGVRGLASTGSKKKITRSTLKGKKTVRKLVKPPVAVYNPRSTQADFQAIKNFALTLRPHEKQVLLVWVAIALSYTVLGWGFSFLWDYIFG